jgi:hypothetical protein
MTSAKPLPHITFKQFNTLLNEGIFSGFIFALLNAKDETLHQPCQCKDYFQDLFWSEHRKLPVKVYGFDWQSGTIDPHAPEFRIALKYTDEIQTRYSHMQTFINHFDTALGFAQTSIEPTDKAEIVRVTFAGGWTRSAPLLSAFTTLVRLGYSYSPTLDVPQYLEQLSKCRQTYGATARWSPPACPVNYADIQRIPQTLPRLQKLLTGFIPEYPYEKLRDGNAAHVCGILGSPESAWK